MDMNSRAASMPSQGAKRRPSGNRSGGNDDTFPMSTSPRPPHAEHLAPGAKKQSLLHGNAVAPGSSPLTLGQSAGVDRLRQQFGPSPLSVLALKKEHLLDTIFKRFCYDAVVFVARCIPAVWIYGGTVGLAICIIFRYRWGVLLSLTLYSTYTTFHCVTMVYNSCVGILAVWSNNHRHWHGLACKELEMSPMQRSQPVAGIASESDLLAGNSSGREESNAQQHPWHEDTGATDSDGRIADSRPAWTDTSVDLCNPAWDDVFHLVIIATYKTPEEYLKNTIGLLTQYSQSGTNMGVVLALEQREDGAQEKADMIKEYFADRFVFVTATFHPSNMPNHIKGKASNMCWSFQEMATQLCQQHGFTDADQYRIIVTNMDDDSEMHENYFEALTYHFLKAEVPRRYLTIWQPPVAHFKNLASQPGLMRVGSLMGSLGDLARHANPLDCHTPFSSNSISLVLALAVGGWDPDWVSDDWHMMAKCTVMTEGRCRCESIMLPMVNLMPEEDDCCGTLRARWTQVKRHALGVSEVVFLTSSVFLGLMEVPTMSRGIRLLWRTMPLLAKFIEVHFVGSLLGIWPPLCAGLIMFSGMYWEPDISADQVVFNSMLAKYQRTIQPIMLFSIFFGCSLAVVYFHMLKHRCNHNQWVAVKYPIIFWLRAQLEILTMGWFQQVIFGSVPEWIAATRIIFQLKIDHAVAAMIGRPDMGEGF